jgi:hypothetical protein
MKSFAVLLASLLFLSLLGAVAYGQTANTGAIAGTITDSSKAVVEGASVKVTDVATGESRTVLSSANGAYIVSLLSPGTYRLQVTKSGFKMTASSDIPVHVTETAVVNLQLTVGAAAETVYVTGIGEALKTEDAVLGQVVDQKQVASLPLVTRNYTQILGLSTGVSAEVFNAGEIGRGGVDDYVVVGGSSQLDNNFQMNGVQINDAEGSGHFSGGTATPNPDSIQEFKVQTGQYDASAGRNSGANVNVVTKGGTNEWHGNLWEYFRNEDLNANTYFRNEAGQPRGRLRQNQFGLTLGGPIKRDKLLFFASYQGTKQQNGIDTNCSSTVILPVLTGTDRSAAALAASVGPATAFGGYDIAGRLVTASNVSPQALAFFNFTLPNGQYLVPDPQQIKTDPATGLPEGFSSISVPCPYNETQFITNLDWLQNSKSTFQMRFFFAASQATYALPPLLADALPGDPAKIPGNFRNFSLTHTYVFTNHLVNQAEIGFHRTVAGQNQSSPYSYSDIGITAYAPELTGAGPGLAVLGGFYSGAAQTVVDTQNTYTYQDMLSWVHGRHSLRFGAGLGRAQLIFSGPYTFPGYMFFFNYPGLMLGQAPLNPFETEDIAGSLNRSWREWDYNVFVQDDIKLTSRLMVNLGFRFDHLGLPGEVHGENSSWDISQLDPNPPAGGSLAGMVVSNNFPGTLPAGVVTSGNDLGIKKPGQNTLNPRIGFAWTLPGTNRFVLRGGYGAYHQKITNQPFIQQLGNAPFNMVQVQVPAFTSSFANPFPPDPGAFPQFPPYSPSTTFSPETMAENFRAPVWQKYSLSLQSQLAKDLVLEVGYAGGRGTHLLLVRNWDQPALASPENPIRGETTNTLANIQLRVPYEGFSAGSAAIIQPTGFAWDNALQVSLSKRFSHGLQFLASYTFSRDLSNGYGAATGYNGAEQIGDQNNPRRDYGPDYFIRPHRFVFSEVYELPGPKNLRSLAGETLGGWKLSGVATVQTGHRLSLATYTSTNVYGASVDVANLVPGCNVDTSGSTTKRLNNWFNTSCLAPYPVVGADGSTGWGNGGIGISNGPGQFNIDMSLGKMFPLKWPHEGTNVEFKTEFFNILNHPIFSDPDFYTSDTTFGYITGLASNPRIIQFALKLSF